LPQPCREEIELGFAPTVDLAEVGIDISNELPPEIQKAEVVVAGVVIETNRKDAARAFIRFFRQTDSQQVLKARGLNLNGSASDWPAPQSAKAKDIDAESERPPISNAAQAPAVTRN
jgi:ABC-type glycerol-3-phosphate transport system substrate-binding protein